MLALDISIFRGIFPFFNHEKNSFEQFIFRDISPTDPQPDYGPSLSRSSSACFWI